MPPYVMYGVECICPVPRALHGVQLAVLDRADNEQVDAIILTQCPHAPMIQLAVLDRADDEQVDLGAADTALQASPPCIDLTRAPIPSGLVEYIG